MSGSYLSPDGQSRKAEMRSLLAGAVVFRRRRRRAVGAAVGLALIACAAFFRWSSDEPSSSQKRVAPRFEHVELEVVHGNAERVASWIVREADVSRFYVGDDSLSELLDESGHQPGFMRVGSEVELMMPLVDDIPGER